MPRKPSGLVAQRQTMGLPDVDKRCQSIVLKDSTEHIRVSPLIPDGKLITRFFDDVKTLHDCFLRGLKLSGSDPFLGWRPTPDSSYVWISYEQAHKRAMDFGSGLIKKGILAGNNTYVGIYAQNRVQWVIAEQACNMYSMVVVPLYDTLGEDVCQYIVNKVEIAVVVCDVSSKAELLLDKASDMPSLRLIVLMEEASESVKQKASEGQIEIMRFDEIEELGANNPQEKVPPTADDLCTICFTSGTTGTPKGAMLTHGNLVSTCSSYFIHAGIGETFEMYTDDVYISYLPLAHVYERFAQAVIIVNGARIGFFQGDPKKLLDDLAVLRPTIFPLVPRLMNRIYDKVNQAVAKKGRLAKFFFDIAINRKTKEIEKGKFINDGFWDKAFNLIRNMIGGRVRMMTTGAAPVSQEVKTFFRCVFGSKLTEGYGQTENGAIATATIYSDVTGGHVGCPMVNFYYKLDDVPEMDYYAHNDQGEICLKGSGVFQGYFKDAEKTAEALDEDGWLHTGDIGQWLPSGQLKIIDRKKNIFKMSQGEYIAPEKIENVYIKSEYVAQCFVHGESLESSLIAIVVPDEETLPKLSRAKGVRGDWKHVCADETIKKAILEDMLKVGKKAKLLGFEQVKDIHLDSEPFSVENGLLTPTFKAKRQVLSKHYQAQIKSLYQGVKLNRMESMPFGGGSS